MDTDRLVPRAIYEQLESGHPVILLSIVDVRGSSPRHPGSKMAVSADGHISGSIGGSLFEAMAIEEARQVLATQQSKFMEYDLTDDGAEAIGMICGGRATVLLDYIAATAENVELFRYWHEQSQADNSFHFLTHISHENTGISIYGHSLLFSDGKVFGYSPLTAPQLGHMVEVVRNISITTIVTIGDIRIIADPVRNLKTLFCFGAGHVALPMAHIAAMVSFRVVVIDDRPEFANAERFPEAAQICVIKDYGRAIAELEIDHDSFIVIMTRGHQYDRMVLEQALRTKAGYIGMISSRKKLKNIYQAILASGVAKEELERVHSPIGIDIGSETPEEIAVSVVAQLIEKRAGQMT